ncbi:Uncharacterised protein [Streptococcus merionis]|uniref:Uncharacterized protein n=1 Tax=Streptococcus merionis TaxID=400065 RepID=A0A239SLK4_9STRE|nr:Uncharacterised protein [Streptococcus merionis]
MKLNGPRIFILLLFLFVTGLNCYQIFVKNNLLYCLVEVFSFFLLLMGLYRTSDRRK